MYTGDFINLPFPIVANVDGITRNNMDRTVKVYKTRRNGEDNNFKQLYRFNRANVDHVAETFLKNSSETRGGALSNVQKMKCFLRYVGDPGFQVGVGEDLGVHQTTVCKTIWSVCNAIVERSDEWIHFPSLPTELEHAKKMWQSKYKFPSAIGAIDCTHVLIKRPGKKTNIFNILQDNASGGLLLADEAYPLTPWMMTPYRDPTTSSQKVYNAFHKRERVIIERVFGQVKQRFPLLQSKVRVKTERIPRMIAACFVLHNVAKHFNDKDFYPEETITYCIAVPRPTVTNSSLLQRGLKRRDAIASFLRGDNVH
ncbi:putative nuclease HARBI1 [Armigeres subalbatus]|uniref:putative nuclease HARBI1 n=1 Tax=Armigeres subalbatus TaxID=124917 RepID=UPI002ED1D1AE